jgi:hypothetical protein
MRKYMDGLHLAGCWLGNFFLRNVDELLPDQHHFEEYIILHTHHILSKY